jgi:hypothetical protein
MNKRFYLLILFVAAIIGIGLVVWFILRPVLPFGGTPAEQPPALRANVETPFDPTKAAPQPPETGEQPAVDANSPEEQERQAEAALNRQAMDFAARQGTYSNADGFESLRGVFPSVTSELRTKLEERRNQLLKDHPTYGTAWSQTIRTLSSSIEQASLPIGDRTNATLVVQSQQITEDAHAGKTSSLVTIQIDFVKQNGFWIPSDVLLQPLAP